MVGANHVRGCHKLSTRASQSSWDVTLAKSPEAGLAIPLRAHFGTSIEEHESSLRSGEGMLVRQGSSIRMRERNELLLHVGHVNAAMR